MLKATVFFACLIFFCAGTSTPITCTPGVPGEQITGTISAQTGPTYTLTITDPMYIITTLATESDADARVAAVWGLDGTDTSGNFIITNEVDEPLPSGSNIQTRTILVDAGEHTLTVFKTESTATTDIIYHMFVNCATLEAGNRPNFHDELTCGSQEDSTSDSVDSTNYFFTEMNDEIFPLNIDATKQTVTVVTCSDGAFFSAYLVSLSDNGQLDPHGWTDTVLEEHDDCPNSQYIAQMQTTVQREETDDYYLIVEGAYYNGDFSLVVSCEEVDNEDNAGTTLVTAVSSVITMMMAYLSA